MFVQTTFKLALISLFAQSGSAFGPQHSLHTSTGLSSSKVSSLCLMAATTESSSTLEEKATVLVEGFKDDLQLRWKIAQDSNSQGNSFKQVLADVLAGEYDVATTQAQVQEAIDSAPMVLFTWKTSPSCVKAIEALEDMGLVVAEPPEYDPAKGHQVKIIRLDDPWEEGNPLRAELGKLVGRTSVPACFIGGAYVGGYDGGNSSEEAPGLVALAFRGQLRPALQSAGLLDATTSEQQEVPIATTIEA